MTDKAFDVVVIGAGAGGVPAAIRARQLGASVAAVEKEQVGGVCMNRGCIPTKALMETACFLRTLKRADVFGIRVSDFEVDWDALMAKKEDLVQYLRMGTEALLRSNEIPLYRGSASFKEPNRIEVDGQPLEAKYVIIATGSTWATPAIAGIDREGVITTDDLLSAREIPATVAVLGSGPVELEAAQYLLFMGSRVTLIEEESRILAQEDRELSRRLSGALKEQGMEILTRMKVQEIKQSGERLSLVMQGKEGETALDVERVLHVQRRPNFDGLDLQAAGLSAAAEGLRVNDHLQTNVAHIYAIGDATGAPWYSHRASAMGIRAAENALARKRPFDERLVSRAFFTSPGFAAVGLTEQEAKKQGYDIKVAAIPYSINSKAMMMLETDGAVKVVSESQYGEILGVHIVGPHAVEMIAEGALAMEVEATVEELADAVRVHPSLSESQVDAAREAMGRGIYVLR
jgi:dihydrolipoamide dehydrogenase